MIFTTSICANYLPRAAVLGESIKQHYPKAKFFPCLLERSLPENMSDSTVFTDILLTKDVVSFNFDHFIFRHNIVEASTAVKGDLMRYLFREFPEEDTIIYLDPDVCVYSNFPELEMLLDDCPIVLTPHLINKSDFVPMEVSILEHGLYNLGFLALRRSEEAFQLLDWWRDRLHRMCFDAKYTGIFTDQKWFDLVPLFFKVRLLTHAGYNVGPWALNSREITIDGCGNYFFSGEPLRFIHFSGFPETFYFCINNWAPSGKELLTELANAYAKKLGKNSELSSHSWSYGQYLDGRRISEFARIRWRKMPVDGNFSPFGLSNKKILGKYWPLASFDKYYIRAYKKFYEKMRSYFHIWD